MTANSRPVRVLVVCTANECRSVYAVDEMRSVGFDSRFSFTSAGTQANPGAPRCVEAQHSFSDPADHFSQVLDSASIAAADLILVMDRDHRARVAEIDPQARFRCFTLPEIARLSELLNSAIKREQMARDAEFVSLLPANWKSLTNLRRVQWWVNELNEARGFSDPVDDAIADAHGTVAAQHKETFEAITQAVSQFATNTLNALNLGADRQLVAGGH